MGKAMEHRWEKVPNWECFVVNREKTILVCVCGRYKKLAGRNKTLTQCGKTLMKKVELGEPTSFLDHIYLGCTQRECETSKDIVENCRNMFESRISAGTEEKLFCSVKPESRHFFHDLMIWVVMRRNAWNDIASW